MIERITYSDEESPDPNHSNSEPVGMREITEAEFAQSEFFTFCPVAIEYRQIIPKRPEGTKGVQVHNKVYSIRIYWMNTEPGQADGFAMRNDYYEGKVRYYRVGCDHDYKELSVAEARKKGHSHFGNCYHVTECAHCKRIFAYDSSG